MCARVKSGATVDDKHVSENGTLSFFFLPMMLDTDWRRRLLTFHFVALIRAYITYIARSMMMQSLDFLRPCSIGAFFLFVYELLEIGIRSFF